MGASNSNWVFQAARNVRVGSAGLALLTVAAWAAGPGTGAASASVAAFNTAGTHSFVVPANVSSLAITAIGGAGGACIDGATGGEGATISEIVSVTPGAQLTVSVAGSGAACNATSGAGTGGVGGGGASGTPNGARTDPSGGGGGASLVRAPTGILIVAGGGGGATEGSSAVNGGNAGSPGADGGVPGSEGQSGTQTAGGTGGAAGGVNATAGSPGAVLAGGAGGNGDTTGPSLGGPGGGAGYYGGGGAGGSAVFTNTGGGGGGSSYTSPGATSISGSTPTTAAPEVVISYSAQPAPAAITEAASGISLTKATLNGIVNPESLPTTYQFQYGTTTKYGHTTTASSAGSGGSTVNVSAVLGSLKPNTKYHFRIIADSASGATMGTDMKFKTKPGVRRSTSTRPRCTPGRSFISRGAREAVLLIA